jgi:hypothetical protein
MVGVVVGLCCVAPVGVAVGIGVGTLGVGVGWDLSQIRVGAIKGDTGMARPERRIRGISGGCGGCMGVHHDASTCACVVGSLRVHLVADCVSDIVGRAIHGSVVGGVVGLLVG